MSSYYLSIGSNVDSANAVPACIRLLKEKFDVTKISSIYETEPIGPAGGNVFWNLAAQIQTSLDREALDRELKQIEEKLGRKRDPQNKFAPRTIDLDILPQKDYEKFPFIMIPLAEISPEEKDPETGKKFLELADEFKKEKKTYRKIRLESHI